MANDLFGAHIGAAAALPVMPGPGATTLPFTVLIERAALWLRRAARSFSAPRARS